MCPLTWHVFDRGILAGFHFVLQLPNKLVICFRLFLCRVVFQIWFLSKPRCLFNFFSSASGNWEELKTSMALSPVQKFQQDGYLSWIVFVFASRGIQKDLKLLNLLQFSDVFPSKFEALGFWNQSIFECPHVMTPCKRRLF